MIELYYINITKFKNNWIELNYKLLSKNDIFRLKKIKIDKIKNRFIITRILLYKILISKWINLNEITLKEYKKPLVKENKIFISISYSDNYSIIWISLQNIWIDIENIRNNLNLDKNIILNENEINCKLISKYNIFKIWTIKESVLKLMWIWLYMNIKLIDLRLFKRKNKYILYENKKIYLKSYKKWKKYISIASYDEIVNLKIISIKNEYNWF
jgi:phosphopantetheinyl transferase